MRVREAMSDVVLTIGPGHTLRAAARRMAERNVGAAVVVDGDLPGPGIVTERDILRSIGAGEDPDVERVAEHLTDRLVFAEPEWSLEEAAVAMVRRRVSSRCATSCAAGATTGRSATCRSRRAR